MGKNKGTRGGGAGGADQFKGCDDVNIDGLLASQQPKPLAYAKESAFVSLVLTKAGTRDIVEVHLQGVLIGTLFANGLDKLIDCMKKSFPFYGVITKLVGARCEIWVRSGKPKP